METKEGCCCLPFMNNLLVFRISVDNIKVDMWLSTEIHIS